jgi:hypothetical protein
MGILHKEKNISSPVTKVWIRVESCTNGSEIKIIPYSLYLFDKDITGINLGSIDLPGTRISLKTGNNISYNDGSVIPTNWLGAQIYRIKSGETQRKLMATLVIDYNNTYIFDTGVINDSDKIFILITALIPGSSESKELEINGAALKAGYTINNVTLDPK